MAYSLTIYLLFVTVYILYSIIAIYHLKRFGFVGDLCDKIAYIYSFISVVIIVSSLILVLTRDWSTGISL